MTEAHKQEPDRVVGEREERLREALEAYERRDRARPEKPCSCMLCVAARAALASSPSPPDREQAIEKVAMVLGGYTDHNEFMEGGYARLRQQARSVVDALFGPDQGDEE